MSVIQTMQSSSLVAIGALVTVAMAARMFPIKAFSYPALIAFCAGYVAGAGAGAAMGATGIADDLIRLGAALITMQVVRALGRGSGAPA